MKTTEPAINYQLDALTRTLNVAFPGDLLSTNADALRESVFARLEAPGEASEWDTCVLDLTAAQMIDSVGLNLIVAILRALRLRGSKLLVHVSNPNVYRSFVFTRLDRQLELIRVS